MKKRIFGLILCVVLIITSTTVFAGHTEDVFGAGDVHGTARLTFENGLLIAQTEPMTSYTTIKTQARYSSAIFEGYCSWVRVSSGYLVLDVDGSSIAAESYHYLDTISKYLSCNYD